MFESIERHLTRHRYQYLLISSFEFAQCIQALKAIQKGGGNKSKQSDCLTPEEIRKLYSTKQLGKSHQPLFEHLVVYLTRSNFACDGDRTRQNEMG